MTSVHNWDDIRIFAKECQSLSVAGHDVYLVAAGNDREIDGVHVCGCGIPPIGRKLRMTYFAQKVYERALDLDCDIYHFHDPELLPYGLKLKRIGKKVIFDSHEDVPADILDKDWIPFPIRWIISKIYKAYETYCVKRFDAVVAATPHIADVFRKRAKKVLDINNFPKLDDIKLQEGAFAERESVVCYTGGLNELRGEKIMLSAMLGFHGTLVLAGSCDDRFSSLKLDNVVYLGKVSRNDINAIYGKSRAGIVLYQPAKNHYESQPIKMFEYMAAGLPVVASDFPYWKDIIEKIGCGICVNPVDVDAVRSACQELLDNPEMAQEMGRKGYEATAKEYNWHVEEKKLISLYKELE